MNATAALSVFISVCKAPNHASLGWSRGGKRSCGAPGVGVGFCSSHGMIFFFPPQSPYSTIAQHSAIPCAPRLPFIFPMQNFAVLERLCLFCSPWELAWEARGARGCLPLLPLPLPPLHKSHSVPCPQLTRPRPGPPFSLPVSSDQLTHAWLCTTELGCV